MICFINSWVVLSTNLFSHSYLLKVILFLLANFCNRFLYNFYFYFVFFCVGSIRMVWSNQSSNTVFLCSGIMVMITVGFYFGDSLVCVYVLLLLFGVFIYLFIACEDLVAFCPMLSWYFIELLVTAKVFSWWIVIKGHLYTTLHSDLDWFFTWHFISLLDSVLKSLSLLLSAFVLYVQTFLPRFSPCFPNQLWIY